MTKRTYETENELVQYILDGSDGEDMEGFAEVVLDSQEEVEDFMESSDGEDKEGIVQEYVSQMTDKEFDEYYSDI